MLLHKSFLRHYPDAYVDNGFAVISPVKSVYNAKQRMMISWTRGFTDPVNDPAVLIRYEVYPCDEVTNTTTGDSWVLNDRTPTFTKVVTVAEFNELGTQLTEAGYVRLTCDASTNQRLINSPVTDTDIQATLNNISFRRSMKANGFA